MKKILCFFLAGLFVTWLTACGFDGASTLNVGDLPSAENSTQYEFPINGTDPTVSATKQPHPAEDETSTEGASSDTDVDVFLGSETALDVGDLPPAENSTQDELPINGTDPAVGATKQPYPAEDETSSEEISSDTDVGNETSNEKNEEEVAMEENTFYVIVGETIFSAVFAENSGAQALKRLLTDGDITIQMSDYGGFEKVGALGQSLPTENSQTTTQAGDIVLYQGNQIVMFYGSNSWSYTRLGNINDLTGWEEALGSGDITVTFSLQGE